MSKTTTTRFDIAEHLRTPEDMVTYLEATLEEADSDVVRAQGRGKSVVQILCP